MMNTKSLAAFTLLFASGVALASCGCGPSQGGNPIVVYKDANGALINNTIRVQVRSIYSNPSYSSYLKGYDSRIIFQFENQSDTEQSIEIKDPSCICEDDASTYSFLGLPSAEKLGGKASSMVISRSVTATPLEESHYSLSMTINQVPYTLHLYDKPDRERAEVKVDYAINDAIVHTVKTKQGRLIGEDYIYESADHLSYCNTWKNPEGQPVGSGTKVDGNLIVNGQTKDTIKCYPRQAGAEYAASILDYIPKDKVVVVPGEFDGKKVTEIGEGLFFSKRVKTIYLPKSITAIGKNNFHACPLLKTIYFEGTAEEWAGIDNLSKDNIQEDVAIRFQVRFGA